MKLSQEALNKIRVAAKLGRSADIQAAVDIALEGINAKRNWHQEVKEWAAVTTGYFSVTSCYFELQAVTIQDKGAIRIALMRLKGEEMIESHPTKNGWYRRIERDCEVIDWQNAPTVEMPLKFPLGIEEYVKIYPKSIIMVAGKSDAGKGHPNGTLILSPKGWIPIEELGVNDDVFTQDGSITKITGVFPRGFQQCFDFIFNDGSSTTVDWEHQWTVKFDYQRSFKRTGHNNPNKQFQQWVTMPTYKIIARTDIGRVKKGKFIIPLNDPLRWGHRDVLLDPYILGLLLGDGCLVKLTPELSTSDKEIVDLVQQRGWRIRENKKRTPTSKIVYSCTKKGLYKTIHQLALRGCHSYRKFIPHKYLFNDVKTRFALLQGLMDTDGTVSKSGKFTSFTSTSPLLAVDVAFLVRSLGGRVTIKSRKTHYDSNGQKKYGRVSYRLSIVMPRNPFRLTRKAQRVTSRYRTINKSIREIRNAGLHPTTCISIAHPSGLYITEDFNVTHNSGFLLEFARLNMDRHEIHLFINEAGDSELAVRLGLFRDIKKEDWKCTFWEREDGFADVIKPNAINIIDYLDVTEDFANIGTHIKDIHNKLERGIALIAIQKNPRKWDFRTGKYIDVDLGIGGAKSIGKSRLYLAIDDGIIKIVKAKNRRGKESPNGITRTFKIYDGHEFGDIGCWTKPLW